MGFKKIFLCFLVSIFIGNCLYANSDIRQIETDFNVIKRLIVRKQIYYKFYPKVQKEYIDKIFFTDNEYIYENYRNIIYNLSVFEIPSFIKLSTQLVKNYNFDLRPVLNLANEKIINLYFEKNEAIPDDFRSQIKKINEFCCNLKEDPACPTWFDLPDSFHEVWNLYTSKRDYINSPKKFMIAIEDLKNHPIPTDPSPPDTEIEAFKFYQIGYITRSYESIANCFNFTQKYDQAYEYWGKAVIADGVSKDLPFFYKLSRKIEMARLQLYNLGEPKKALEIVKKLKEEALQLTGEIILINPVQAETYAFLGECQRYLGIIDDAYVSFLKAEKIYEELEILYGNSWIWGFYHLPIAIIQYHIGDIEFQYEMFESGRKRFDKAFNLFAQDSPGNYTYVAPRFHERNLIYKKLAAEKIKISIDKQKSTKFFSLEK